MISEALGKIAGVSSDWAANGRFCSPRVLWFFEDVPPIYRKDIARYVCLSKLILYTDYHFSVLIS